MEGLSVARRYRCVRVCGMTGGKADAEDDAVGADEGKSVVFNEDSR